MNLYLMPILTALYKVAQDLTKESIVSFKSHLLNLITNPSPFSQDTRNKVPDVDQFMRKFTSELQALFSRFTEIPVISQMVEFDFPLKRVTDAVRTQMNNLIYHAKVFINSYKHNGPDSVDQAAINKIELVYRQKQQVLYARLKQQSEELKPKLLRQYTVEKYPHMSLEQLEYERENEEIRQLERNNKKYREQLFLLKEEMQIAILNLKSKPQQFDPSLVKYLPEFETRLDQWILLSTILPDILQHCQQLQSNIASYISRVI